MLLRQPGWFSRWKRFSGSIFSVNLVDWAPAEGCWGTREEVADLGIHNSKQAEANILDTYLMIKSSTTKKGMSSVFHRTDNIDLKPFTIIIISFWISPSQSWAHETYFGSLFLTASSSPPSTTQSGYLGTWIETNKHTCLPFDNLTIMVSTHRHFKVQISHWTLWKSCRAEENLSIL